MLSRCRICRVCNADANERGEICMSGFSVKICMSGGSEGQHHTTHWQSITGEKGYIDCFSLRHRWGWARYQRTAIRGWLALECDGNESRPFQKQVSKRLGGSIDCRRGKNQEPSKLDRSGSETEVEAVESKGHWQSWSKFVKTQSASEKSSLIPG